MTIKIVIGIVLSLFVGQTIKMLIHKHNYRKLNLWVYFEDGGMPSAHSTATIALVTALFYETGLSAVFYTAALFTMLLLNDTMKVRRQPGIQSELMARFIDVREILRRKMTESIGHTPEQVFLGALLGFLVTSIVYLF